MRQEYYRIIDANVNRAAEGLRVCEECCRFALKLKTATGHYKAARHRLADLAGRVDILKRLRSRDAAADIGRPSTASEFQRRDLRDVYLANSQRAKESVRVLEEFSKLFDKPLAEDFKALRYQLYTLEQRTAARMTTAR